MAQLVKYLPNKYGDQSLDPQDPYKKPGMMTYVCNPIPGTMEAEAPLVLTARLISWNLWAPGSLREPVSESKVETAQGRDTQH